ncbi:MAG: DUF308 domain-containing protein [Eubacterium sp.]|nr:DUF308 domain-containing protein [Eubacterium sp.]
MVKLIDKVKKISIVTIILAVLGGIALIAQPEACQKYLSLFIGIAFVAVGLTGIAVSLLGNKSYLLMTLSVLILIGGVIICVMYKPITSLIIMVIGIFMIVSGVTDFFTSLKVLGGNRFFGILSMLLSVLTAVFGFIAVFHSYSVQASLIQFLGVALLVYAVLDIIAFIEVKTLVRKVKKAVDEAENADQEIETTGEIIE